MLCFVGGIIGLVCGIVMTQIIQMITGWVTYIPLHSILISFSVSAAIGVIFGYYPAKNASELKPIDALRYE